MKMDAMINILKERNTNLKKLFFPKTVAIIGATEREKSVGKTLILNLKDSFKGEIFLINPKRKKIYNLKAYPSIKAVKKKIDLAVIAIPSKSVPNIIKEAVSCKVSSSIIISAGFKEMGLSGEELEKEIKEEVKKSSLRIVGPNCLGIINPYSALNATFAANTALKGNIAFISQSGALCTAVLDWSLHEKIGFSSFVSVGSMIDVDFADLIDYFGNDKNTKSILIYMESIKDPRGFLSACKKVALTKPIILIKAGKTKQSAKAATSHTGALTENDEVFEAALKRVGVLRVDSIEELFCMAEVLSKQPLPKGENLAIVTNAGGPGVIATDALILNGGKLAKPKKETMEKLNRFLPAYWSHNNPIDILGDADEERYYKAVKIISKDASVDGILVILTPQYMTDPKKVAEKLKEFSKLKDKPILTSWMGAEQVEEGRKVLLDEGIPTFLYPDVACKTFSYMLAYSNNLKNLYEIVEMNQKETSKKEIKKHQKVKAIIDFALLEKRTLLDEYESKKILEAFGIKTCKTLIATSKKDASKKALEIGFPVVVKLYSKEITHKTEVGGVKLNLNDIKSVENAYDEIYKSVTKKFNKAKFQGVTVQKMIDKNGIELILGSSSDAKFGPVILFGSGGTFVEVFKDKNITLPPLNSSLALNFMKKTKIFHALEKGCRNIEKIDLKKLKTTLVKFSSMISEYPAIKECDINPLLASKNEIIALDARIVLHEKDKKLPTLAIRPYPVKYITFPKLGNKDIILRPIKPEDEELAITFFKNSLKEGLAKKFLKNLNYSEFINKQRLINLCFIDYDKEIVLVAIIKKEIIGIGRLSKKLKEAKISLAISKKWENKNLQEKILNRLIKIAKEENIRKIFSKFSNENLFLKKIFEKEGFNITFNKKRNLFYVGKDLRS